MLQAAVFECFQFNLLPFVQDRLCASEVGVGWCHVAEAFVISPVIVTIDERLDLTFEIAWQIVVLQQDTVLQGLMPALDLTLGLRMTGLAVDLSHMPIGWPVGQFRRHIRATFVRQKPRPPPPLGLVEAGGLQGHVHRGGDILILRAVAQFPGDEVMREVVEDGRQIEPAPADDLAVGEVVCHIWFGAVVLS